MIDALDVLSVLLGVFFTVRKLDVTRRRPEDYASVPAVDFGRWRFLRARAYSVGIWVSFLRIVADFAFVHWSTTTGLSWDSMRVGGASIDALWAVGLAVALYRGRAARKLGTDLGIEPLTPRSSGA